jgi:hypothetical protein
MYQLAEMKTLLFLLMPVLLVACAGEEHYRSGIENLGREWEVATSDIKAFSSEVNSDLATFAKEVSALKLSDDVVKKLNPDRVREYQSAQGAFVDALRKFAPIRIQVAEFMKAWEGKSTEVQALKDGVASGKLTGDIDKQVDELTHLVSQAKESVIGWKATHAAAKAETQASIDKMHALYQTLIGSGAITK